MRPSGFLPTLIAFCLAAVISVLAASVAVTQIEKHSATDVMTGMRDQGHDWVTVSVDGLQVMLDGTAPDEATRFRALTVANNVVDATRVIDRLDVAAAAKIEAPRFSIEILHNSDGVSLIGLIPLATERETLVRRVQQNSHGAKVSDLLETANFAAPDNWDRAVDFGLMALGKLTSSKISIAADRVVVQSNAEGRGNKRRIESELTRAAPSDVELVLDINAPRPVITPFTLRFLLDGDGPRFDACSAATSEGRELILDAARDAGLGEQTDCTIGLGVPSPEWPRAAAMGIRTLVALGGGSVTLSDADITLIAPDTTAQDKFDREVGELEGALPEVFSLYAVLPDPPPEAGVQGETGPPEFTASLNEKGAVQLRGRIRNDRSRTAILSFAKARFGMESVQDATRTDETLPDGWLPRVLAGLQSLAQLNNGDVIVQPDTVEVTGTTGNPDARAEISRILSAQLGSAEAFALKVTYDKKLDPVLGLPTPDECVDQINQVLVSRKITFAPGSADIDAEARDSIERIAELLRTCDDVQMEIGGYTDSQGRETMNQQLSQARAEAVLTALAARRVLTANLEAIGYGEERPIATNETDEGREANRRIEFKLISPEGGGDTGDEAVEDEAVEDGAAEDGAAEDGAAEDGAENTAPEGDIITGGAGADNEQN